MRYPVYKKYYRSNKTNTNNKPSQNIKDKLLPHDLVISVNNYVGIVIKNNNSKYIIFKMDNTVRKICLDSYTKDLDFIPNNYKYYNDEEDFTIASIHRFKNVEEAYDHFINKCINDIKKQYTYKRTIHRVINIQEAESKLRDLFKATYCIKGEDRYKYNMLQSKIVVDFFGGFRGIICADLGIIFYRDYNQTVTMSLDDLCNQLINKNNGYLYSDTLSDPVNYLEIKALYVYNDKIRNIITYIDKVVDEGECIFDATHLVSIEEAENLLYQKTDIKYTISEGDNI